MQRVSLTSPHVAEQQAGCESRDKHQSTQKAQGSAEARGELGHRGHGCWSRTEEAEEASLGSRGLFRLHGRGHPRGKRRRGKGWSLSDLRRCGNHRGRRGCHGRWRRFIAR